MVSQKETYGWKTGWSKEYKIPKPTKNTFAKKNKQTKKTKQKQNTPPPKKKEEKKGHLDSQRTFTDLHLPKLLSVVLVA